MYEIFAPSLPLMEILIRATAAFLAMVFVVRAVPSRNAGHISPNDMLITIVIGTLGATAIMGDGHSISDILLMIVLVLVWAYVLDRLEYRVPALRRLLRHRPTILVERGRYVRRNMRRELVTEEELLAVLRKEGLKDIGEVRSAIMEADGEISVIADDGRRER